MKLILAIVIIFAVCGAVNIIFDILDFIFFILYSIYINIKSSYFEYIRHKK